jgi:hypothetical protein
VLGFAGNGAGVAADAFAVIDDKAKVHPSLSAEIPIVWEL